MRGLLTAKRLEAARSLALLTAALVACAERGLQTALEWRAAYDTVADTVVVRTLGGSAWGDTADLIADLTIGELEGPAEYSFGQVLSLAVAPDGTYLATFGRAGGGPGEYGRPDAGLVVLSDGRSSAT